MKRTAGWTLLLLLLLTTTGAPASSAPPAADALTPITLAPITPTPAVCTGLASIQLPSCGDPCFDPGRQRGCIDDSRGFWQRVECVCSNGVWQC